MGQAVWPGDGAPCGDRAEGPRGKRHRLQCSHQCNRVGQAASRGHVTACGDVAEGPGATRDHLHTAISACEKAKLSGKATVLRAEMQHNSLEPDGITHKAVISSGEKARQPGEALEVLAVMQQKDPVGI